VTNLLEIYLKKDTADATKYFIILTDDIGHVNLQSLVMDLRMKFPKYNYDDG
jgi:homoserine O-acetyltransferase